MKILIFLLGIFWAVNANAQTYYVATTGKDSDCTTIQTIGAPAATINFASACAGAPGTDQGAGKTISVASGTYNQLITDFTSGASWSAPFTIKSASLHGATLKPTTATPPGMIIGTALGTTHHFIIIDGFIIDGSNCTGNNGVVQGPGCAGVALSSANTTDNHDIQISNNEITATPNDGIATSNGQNWRILGNNIHNGATVDLTGHSHGIYWDLSNSVMYGNTIAAWPNGYCLHMYNPNIQNGNNQIYQNNFSGCGFTGGQWAVLYSGTNNEFFSNIIYGSNAAIIVGHFSSPNTDNNVIYENTIYNNAGGGYGAIVLQGQSNTFIENNIIRSSNAPWDTSFETPALFTNQICDTTIVGCTNADPLFVNPGANDFHLQSGSPAINAGVTLGAPYNIDYAGTARPQGAGYDIGAYEFIPAPSGAPTGMVRLPGGPGVGVSSCGGTPTITGNDSTGQITVGTGTVTSCTVTFSGTYGKAPNCLVSLGSGLATLGITSSTSGFVVTSSATVNTDVIYYICVQPGTQ